MNNIEKIYNNDDFVLIDGYPMGILNNLDVNSFDVLDTFHAQEVHMVEKKDKYFCGMRANHFIVEIGWSEAIPDESKVYVVTANHKGHRAFSVFVDWYVEGGNLND